ncbi:MAG: 50S ribosomal protein L10 [Aerococcus sp.]|nr:50S ribosomal protein L10 [Aerococcus sp.]
MSEATIQVKQQMVNEIVDQVKASDGIVAVDYLGLTVAEATELRRQLREEGVTFKVLKNTMMRRAMDEAGIEYSQEVFEGPTAVAFSGEDATAPARILKNFSKDAEALELKGGFFGGKELSLDEINRIASLPNREGVLSMLLSVLQAPVRNVAYAVKAIQDKAESEGQEA